MSIKNKSKDEKIKGNKIIEKKSSDNDENGHELSFYINDRVKLMKQVINIIKPKKIKSMAPDCIKNLEIEEINSMLLEELLGISNKRLKYIFNGQDFSEDSSSTDPEEEKHLTDVISLDDVSDDDFVIDVESGKFKKRKNGKKGMNFKKIKKEKDHTSEKNMDKVKEPLQEDNLMSVLELLELQARARAIRSQLMLETNKIREEMNTTITQDSDTDDAVIIELPKNDEIVITSSDSENDQSRKIQENTGAEKETETEDAIRKNKIRLIRNRVNLTQLGNLKQNIESQIKESEKNKNLESVSSSHSGMECDKIQSQFNQNSEINNINQFNQTSKQEKNKNSTSKHDDDEIILIVDQEDIDGIMGE